MRIVADSGSTKVDWRAIAGDGSVLEIETAGINPFFQTEDQIVNQLKEQLLPHINEDVTEIFFYGAGISSSEKIEMLRGCFSSLFPNSKSEAYTDLLAAARALCGKKPGIAAILGTGANSCFYDGEKIIDNVPACGYILGDEGSGAVLGKRLLSDFLKRQIPVELSEQLGKRYELTYNSVVERVYRQPFPNRFLAGFSHFISEHKEHPYIQNLLRDCFNDFIVRNILHYNYKNYSLNIVGSVAFYYKDIIEEVAGKHGVTIGLILKSPIEGLLQYHL